MISVVLVQHGNIRIREQKSVTGEREKAANGIETSLEELKNELAKDTASVDAGLV